MVEKSGNHETGWNFANTYVRLPKVFYRNLNLNPVKDPKLVILNQDLATSLGFNAQTIESKGAIGALSGSEAPPGALIIAQAYAGHQFGHFTMLGDGRALLLGEQITPQGERFDIQLKGSGRTPFSRGGDGRAALGPMLREYIISEAMHGLEIPTTRSLAVVTTGELVIRETQQPGAVLTRVAASHIRVGTFQYAAEWGTKEDLRALADYTLQRHFPHAAEADNSYLALLMAVIQRQAQLIAKWQLVGFIHGVMNTDNMALSGETIDYGPCAFMDRYDPVTVFSSIDTQGRYAYGNQPQMAAWNLARFAETLLPLLHEKEEKAIQIAQDAISDFAALYEKNWLAGMRAKLGIYNEESNDKELIEDLLTIMDKYRADYTNTFRCLTLARIEDTSLTDKEKFRRWYEKWQERLSRQPESKEDVQVLMKNSNPAIIPRNHQVEAALEAAVNKGDYSIMDKLLAVLKIPYAHATEQDEYTTPPAPSSCGYQTYCGT